MQVRREDFIKPRKSNSLPRPIEICGRGRSDSDYAGLCFSRSNLLLKLRNLLKWYVLTCGAQPVADCPTSEKSRTYRLFEGMGLENSKIQSPNRKIYMNICRAQRNC